MRPQSKQLLGLSVFAMVCMAIGMGLSHRWVARAQEDKPIVLDGKGANGMPPIAEVAEKLNPTVVAIENTSFVKVNAGRMMPGSPFGDPFEWFFGPGMPGPRQQPKEEDEQRLQAGGSGVIISADGEILTNHHVIDGIRGGETEIKVKTSDGRSFKATIIGKDKDLDIALIKIDATHLPYAQLGDSDALRVGEWVVAIGNPLGLEHTVTQGIISAKGRNASVVGGGSGLERFLQTDAAINRGNSGGPLLNLKGEVVGINTAINPMGQNIGFAVPINKIKRILADLHTGKRVSRGYLGVLQSPLDKDFQSALGIKEGVVVSDVVPGEAAEKAGVQRLDVITAVNGKKVQNTEEVIDLISERRAGDTVTLSLFRDGKSLDVKVVLGERKPLNAEGDEQSREDDQDGNSKDAFSLDKTYGFKVEAITRETRQQFGLTEGRNGVVVTSVAPRSNAYDKLPVGWVITAVRTRPVKDLKDFREEVRKSGGKALILQVQHPSKDQRITVAVSPR